MPADVEEGARPVVAAHDEDRYVTGPGREALAGSLRLSHMPDVLPGVAEDPLLLAAQHVGIGVPAPRNHAANLPASFRARRLPSPMNLRMRAAAPPPSAVRVLVVDDDLLYAEAISALLRLNEGIEVVGIAGDGREAVDQAAALEPDIVLMDIQMPRLNGLAATRTIRRTLPRTKVLMMTALTGDEYVERAVKAGAEACVRKFSHAGELLTTIEQIVGAQLAA